MQKPFIVIIAVSLFFVSLFVIDTIHQYEQAQQRDQIMDVLSLLATEVPPPWEKKLYTTDPEYIQTLNETEKAVQEERKFEGSNMTREELGRHGWALLHMMSATLPEKFDNAFALKINVYLNLLQNIKILKKNQSAQFYPCKLCAGHFLEILDKNPYLGNTREDFMQYMCKLHNIVNKNLKKEIYNCEKVHDQWGGYCGCETELKNSIEKYKESD